MNVSKPVSLNMQVRGLEQSATIAINDLCREMQTSGLPVYRLGLGQSPFPIPTSVVEALRANAHQKDYLPAKGLPALREAVAEFHARENGIETAPENVLVGPGSKELMFLLQIVYYGELIVPTPCWVSYVPQARIVGRNVSLIHTRCTDGCRLTTERFRAHCARQNDDSRPRILILNYPSNPVGTTYSDDDLAELAEVARQYQVLLLSDEIYGQLHHEGKHTSIARHYPEGTIISSGLSKWCGAGGWRLGTFTFPDELDWLLEKMAAVASETYTSVCAPIQHAAITAFQGGTRIQRYLWHARRILRVLGRECHRILTDAGLKVPEPEGAFYLFLDFSSFAENLASRGITDSEGLCKRLLEDTGVAILPGCVFGRHEEELSARLAYVDFDGAKTLAAGETIPIDQPLPEDFTAQYCGRILDACHLIADWATL